MDSLTERVLKTIEETYCCKYTKKLVAKKVDNTYIVFLYLRDQFFNPLQILWDGDNEDEFIEFLKKELCLRRLDTTEYIKLHLHAPDTGQLIDGPVIPINTIHEE